MVTLRKLRVPLTDFMSKSSMAGASKLTLLTPVVAEEAAVEDTQVEEEAIVEEEEATAVEEVATAVEATAAEAKAAMVEARAATAEAKAAAAEDMEAEATKVVEATAVVTK